MMSRSFSGNYQTQIATHTRRVLQLTQHLIPVPVATPVAVQVLPPVMSISSVSGTHQLHHHGNCVKLNWRVNDCKKNKSRLVFNLNGICWG